MAQSQVVCIIKRGGHYNPHERISHLGATSTQGVTVYTQEQLILWIESAQHSFYVARPSGSVWVEVATRNGRKHLKTQADGAEPNNLLALPEC
jgi:hypothetical protein